MALDKDTSKSKVVRISPVVSEYLENSKLDGENLNDALIRLLGISTSKGFAQSKQLSKIPEVRSVVGDALEKYLIDADFWKAKKRPMMHFKSMSNAILETCEKNKLIAKYPRLIDRTNNGQTRLAHIIKTMMIKYYSNWKKDRKKYS